MICQRPARERVSLVRDSRPIEQAAETDLRGGKPNQRVRMPPQQFARGAVGEAEPFVAVESEHRDVDFCQHLIEQCVGFQGFKSLRPQRRAEPVRLEHDVAERIALAPVPPADRVVAAAQRLQQVRDRAQRLDRRAMDCDCESDPGADQEDDDEAMHRVCDRRVAQQEESGEKRGHSAREREQHDARLERQAPPAHDRAASQGLSRLGFFCRHSRKVYAFGGSRCR